MLFFASLISYSQNDNKKLEEVANKLTTDSTNEQLLETVNLFTEIIEKDSSNYRAYRYRSLCYFYILDYDNALKDIEHMKNESEYDYYMFKAVVLKNKKDYKMSLLSFDEAIRMAPKDVYPHVEKGLCYFEMENYSLAISEFDKALLIDNKLCFLYEHKAKAEFAVGNKENACSCWKKSIELGTPNNTELKSLIKENCK